ncbi:MAG: glycosyltransferase [Candidatus Omnitrophica bacterium]|nr:glycosyltransferase [Candidatus Omnitrophota bacterium]
MLNGKEVVSFNTMRTWVKKRINDSKVINAFWYCVTPYSIRLKQKELLFDDSQFFCVNLGCKGDAFKGYVNIDTTRTKGRVYVSSLLKLPFKNQCVKQLLVDFDVLQGCRSQWHSIVHEWSRVVVPNCIVTIDNLSHEEDFRTLLVNAGFKSVFIHSKQYVPVSHFVYSPSDAFLNEHNFFYKEESGHLIISHTRIDYAHQASLREIPWRHNRFQTITLNNMLEYIAPDSLESFFQTLSRHCAEHGRIYITVDSESYKENDRWKSFFSKASLAQYVHETGFAFHKIERVNGTITAVVQSKHSLLQSSLIQKRSKKRVCVFGQYIVLRYLHLGLDWDGLVHAFDELGWDYLLLECMRNMDYDLLRKAVLEYKPDYIFVMLKETLPFLQYIKNDCKRLGIKTIFWYCDPDTPWDMNLDGVLDYMFLTNQGQIEEYKKTLHIKNVYFMAQAISPYVMYRQSCTKRYDVGFIGAISKASLHDTRRRIMRSLSKRYCVGIRNNIRNDVTEFYSKSRMVFGGSDFSFDLYTSNRLWVALGCGAAYLTYKFPGIEKLIRNREQVLWFETIDELLEIVDYYLKHEREREQIGKNAAELTHDKHTYTHRLHNIFDIVEGKTTDFYGFL